MSLAQTSSAMSTIRTIAALLLSWMYLSVFSLLYVLFTVLTLGYFRGSTFHHAAHAWSKIPLLLTGITIKTVHLERLFDEEPKVVLFNHQSMLDLFWLSATFPPRGVAIIKKEFAFIPIINIALWSGGFIFLDRQNRQKSVKALQNIGARVQREKLALYIAPEGTRTHDGSLLPFKRGPFHIAIDNNLPIYPLVVQGAYELLPKDKSLPKPGTITVTALPPIQTANWQKENLSQHIEEVRATMLQALESSK